jgi:hypothetical protein
VNAYTLKIAVSEKRLNKATTRVLKKSTETNYRGKSISGIQTTTYLYKPVGEGNSGGKGI